ncbi:hypothetical protein HHL11_18165 [Ramlibacter sp. G-1-2-2]|uniref:DUF2846 domain-containing protein n=1 Tax=Ramlibacter agri TaxID=2728837 RepID=A0A848H847_9BURK|nr:hypothetical protein [Ramlibacter agri]NML45679.1 hypothetical protein [Ramlibacter agri]
MKILPLRLLLTLAFALLVLCGCATSPTTTDGASLRPNQGLLAFHVTSNADAFLGFGDFASTSTFGSRFNENMVGAKGQLRIKAGETYYMVPLDAGDYMFTKFTVHPKFAWLQATNRFKVRANAITYIGHINIKVTDSRFSIQALDHELEMRTYLADTYPAYFKAMDFQKSFAELSLR